MSYFIACRPTSYGPYQERAWTHLPQLGIRHIEMHVPADVPATRQRLRDAGLAASSVQARCDIASPEVVEQMRPQLAAVAELGAPLCLIALQPVPIARDIVIARLRSIGDEADKVGVTIAMETHPDLLTNGDIARATMAAIDHPHVRINFDTGNVYFYNEGIGRNSLAAATELRKVLPFVAALHLKDALGGYQQRPFPALGAGIIDFPAVYSLLRDANFSGPCTIELDTKPLELTEVEQVGMLEDSVDYLQRIGAMA